MAIRDDLRRVDYENIGDPTLALVPGGGAPRQASAVPSKPYGARDFVSSAIQAGRDLGSVVGGLAGSAKEGAKALWTGNLDYGAVDRYQNQAMRGFYGGPAPATPPRTLTVPPPAPQGTSQPPIAPSTPNKVEEIIKRNVESIDTSRYTAPRGPDQPATYQQLKGAIPDNQLSKYTFTNRPEVAMQGNAFYLNPQTGDYEGIAQGGMGKEAFQERYGAVPRTGTYNPEQYMAEDRARNQEFMNTEEVRYDRYNRPFISKGGVFQKYVGQENGMNRAGGYEVLPPLPEKQPKLDMNDPLAVALATGRDVQFAGGYKEPRTGNVVPTRIRSIGADNRYNADLDYRAATQGTQAQREIAGMREGGEYGREAMRQRAEEGRDVRRLTAEERRAERNLQALRDEREQDRVAANVRQGSDVALKREELAQREREAGTFRPTGAAQETSLAAVMDAYDAAASLAVDEQSANSPEARAAKARYLAYRNEYKRLYGADPMQRR